MWQTARINDTRNRRGWGKHFIKFLLETLHTLLQFRNDVLNHHINGIHMSVTTSCKYRSQTWREETEVILKNRLFYLTTSKNNAAWRYEISGLFLFHFLSYNQRKRWAGKNPWHSIFTVTDHVTNKQQWITRLFGK